MRIIWWILSVILRGFGSILIILAFVHPGVRGGAGGRWGGGGDGTVFDYAMIMLRVLLGVFLFYCGHKCKQREKLSDRQAHRPGRAHVPRR